MNLLRQLLLVGAGGFLGSVARYLVGGWVHRAVPFLAFPAGTMVVNVAGCLAIGFLGGLADHHQLISPQTRLLAMVGFLGGFTTFSTFGFETFALAQDAERALALLNVGASVMLGLISVWAGYGIARMV